MTTVYPRSVQITRDFHNRLLQGYHTNGHLLSNDESWILKHCIEAYHRQTWVPMNVHCKAKDILRDLYNRS